jgi:hypothetical protein
MGVMRKTKTEQGAESYWFWCGGCGTHHTFRTKKPAGDAGPIWTFDGNEELPTFSPSLLVRYGNRPGDKRCHLFLKAGMVQYLGDCTHKLKGLTVPVEPPRFGD